MMRRPLVTVVGIGLVLLLAFSACTGGKPTPTATPSPAPSPAPTTQAAAPTTPSAKPSTTPAATTAAPASPKKVYTIKYQDNYGETGVSGLQAKRMAELWDKASGGQIKFEYYWSQALYKANDAVVALTRGTLDAAQPIDTMLQTVEPRFGGYTLPLLFDSYSHVTNSFNSAIVNDMKANLEKMGIKVIYLKTACSPDYEKEAPPAYGFFTKKTINTMADLKGQRIRTLSDPQQIKMLELLGANPQVVAAGEVATALQTGMLDGLITAPTPVYFKQFNIFAHLKAFLWNVAPWVGMGSWVMNKKWWDQLPKDLQDKLMATIPEYMKYSQWDLYYNEKVEATKQIKANMTVTNLSPEELQKWFGVLSPTWKDWSGKVTGGADFVKMAEDTRPKTK